MSFPIIPFSRAQLVATQGDGNSVQMTTAGNALSLERTLPVLPISCLHCQQPVVPALDGSCDPLIGKFRWLPDVDCISPYSIAHDPTHGVNAEAGNHPALPVMWSQCGCLVFCLQMTSFGGRTIDKKYSGAHNPRKFYEKYIPLYEPLRSTPATHSAGFLEYLGKRLSQQTYVNLEFGYWIEECNLKPILQFPSWLTGQALTNVKQEYAAAEIERQRTGGGRSRERIARASRSLSPPVSSPPSPVKLNAGASVFVPQGSYGFGLPTPSPSPERVDPLQLSSWR